ncbi:DUF2255 family protein [Nocardia sp. NPDC058379]|uniref:DUF2255 family protein n=1 Tax=unclassified Nocardia TaxID=2637762 RepID=UPI00364C1A41
MTWNDDQLDRLGRAHELEITTRRTDDTLRRWIPIWAVRVGPDLYIRSAFGTRGGWYRHAVAAHAARIRAGGIETDVRPVPVTDQGVEAAVSAAYRDKYRGQGSALDTMVAADATGTTLRLEPGGE